MLGQGAHPRPIFAVVVKSPCLAVKYPTGNGFIRRFQLKFSSDREFYTALAVLSEIRCPFSESNAGSSHLSRRPTSSQWHSHSGPSSRGIREPFPPGASATLFPVLPSASALGSASNIIAASSLPPSSSGTAQATAPDASGTGLTSSYTELEAKQPQRTIESHTEEQLRPNAPSAPPKPTTTAACHDITILNQLLPPKRELPFSNLPAKRSRRTAKEPFTSTRSETLSAGDQIPATTENDAATAEPSSSQAPGTKRPTPKRQTATPGALKRSITSVPPLTLAGEPSTQPIQSLSSLAQPATIPIPGTPQVNIHGQNPISESRNNIGHRCEQQEPTPSDLSSYLSAPTQERTARLENWICQNLENDGFIKLCQDVEGIWRRIAFGS
ncbi:hypothetical protein V6Z96_004432 [Aspergillus fumigatus]|nr:hypothetical protein KXX11_008157 [Aspergillus fumigatus]KMK63108.1 hypothetical protein Y699_03938 [Aspergillus fumigatus Z5]KAH1423909.1 hypothetical protein KXX64_007654 [Aspergillus fumigatus]KAH1625686.1 hypothetical protein KXX21_006180 [Aspergillus fumigatus]KAH1642456.1 hypothetical protein KXX39_008199 [Aspergillus fumigatus]